MALCNPCGLTFAEDSNMPVFRNICHSSRHMTIYLHSQALGRVPTLFAQLMLSSNATEDTGKVL